MESKHLLALNKEYMDWYNSNDVGYSLIELQGLVNFIINWYELKYSDYEIDTNSYDNLTKNMTIDAFRDRVPNKMGNLLDESFTGTNIMLFETTNRTLRVVPYGLIHGKNMSMEEKKKGIIRAHKFVCEFNNNYGTLLNVKKDDLKTNFQSESEYLELLNYSNQYEINNINYDFDKIKIKKRKGF